MCVEIIRIKTSIEYKLQIHNDQSNPMIVVHLCDQNYKVVTLFLLCRLCLKLK